MSSLGRFLLQSKHMDLGHKYLCFHGDQEIASSSHHARGWGCSLVSQCLLAQHAAGARSDFHVWKSRTVSISQAPSSVVRTPSLVKYRQLTFKIVGSVSSSEQVMASDEQRDRRCSLWGFYIYFDTQERIVFGLLYLLWCMKVTWIAESQRIVKKK